jgi:tetratricopeptide (TPR) repeat protein
LRRDKKIRKRAVRSDATGIEARPAVKHALLLAAVIGFTWLAYSNSFHAPFLLDNDGIVLKDTRVHAAAAVGVHRILTGQYWPTANTGLYRPLDTLSFLLDYAVLGHGPDPYGYHWLNFLLHAVNIVLVYLLGLAIFERSAHALLVSALWGLHPVLTESVTNIVGRADLLAAFGVLAALLGHRKALEAVGMRRFAWLAAIGLASAIGIFSKESAIAAVAVFAIYDFTFARDFPWARRLPSYAAAAIPCLIYLYVRSRVLAGSSYQATPFTDNPLLGAGFWSARMTAIQVIGRYFALLLWPARLSWDYSYNAIPLFGWGAHPWEDLKAVAALLGSAAAAIAAIRLRQAQRPLSFAVAFFFATLMPTANLLLRIGTIMAERFLYLPAVGFAIAFVWALDALSRRLPADRDYRWAVLAGVLAMLLGFAARTYARNGDWLDQQRFWLSAAEAAPGSYKANMAAAAATVPITDQDVARSAGYAERALAILDGLPDFQNSSTAYRDAGVFYRNVGDRAAPQSGEKLSWYRKSLSALLRSERIELASDERYRAENAARGKPGLTLLPSALYLALGRTYLRLGDTPHALAALERGRALESSPELLEELAQIYKAAGDSRKAAAALVEALAVDPQRVDLISTLAELYGQIDPNGCAVSHQGGTVNLNPDCPLVHADICSASRNVIGNYLRRGQQFEAHSIRQVAEKDLGCGPGLLP